MDPAVLALIDIRSRLLGSRGLLPTRRETEAMISLCEAAIPPGDLPPVRLRRGQHQYSVTCKLRGVNDRRHGTPRDDCPYPDNPGFSRVRRKAWLAGWDEEHIVMQKKWARPLRAVRRLTMPKPHGRAL